ncbi:MAG: hypothetical protein Q7K43_04750, partial [Candidatus Woesearchaeota archaeon]|nr:hypothetical protein [Candidatus Woesearchaeota archaeon]
GIRHILEVYHRPLLACTVKNIKACKQALLGGIDIVFCPDTPGIVEQAVITTPITGKHTLILPDITNSSGAMLERAQTLSRKGAIGFSTSIAGGLDGIISLRTYRHSVLSAHNTLPNMSTQVSIMLSALAGADIVNATQKNDLKPVAEILPPQKMPFVRVNVKCTKNIPELITKWGNNIILELTNLEHPEVSQQRLESHSAKHFGGIINEVRAARQAIEATMHRIPLKEYAQAHEELMQAL